MLYFLEALRKQRSVIDGERGKEKHYLNKQILKDVFFPNLRKILKLFQLIYNFVRVTKSIFPLYPTHASFCEGHKHHYHHQQPYHTTKTEDFRGGEWTRYIWSSQQKPRMKFLIKQFLILEEIERKNISGILFLDFGLPVSGRVAYFW